MTTYVLIPGARPLRLVLRRSCRRTAPRGVTGCTALTLTGIAERAHLLHAGVNLETHIVDVVAELEAHNVSDAVLPRSGTATAAW